MQNDLLKVIDLVTARIFHDFGNSVNALHFLLEDGDLQNSKIACNETINHLKLLRTMFVNCTHEDPIELIKNYLKAKEKNVQLQGEGEIENLEYSRLLLLSIFIACGFIINDGAISYKISNNSISIDVESSEGIRISENTKLALNGDAEKLDINNVMSYITYLTAEQLLCDLSLQCTDNSHAKIVLNFTDTN